MNGEDVAYIRGKLEMIQGDVLTIKDSIPTLATLDDIRVERTERRASVSNLWKALIGITAIISLVIGIAQATQ